MSFFSFGVKYIGYINFYHQQYYEIDYTFIMSKLSYISTRIKSLI